MHAHVANSSVDVQHLVLGTLALVDDHHVGAAVEIGKCVGDAGYFFAEGVVQRKEMVNLRIERRLGGVGVVISSGWDWWK
jgi:hypothetical protein